VSRLAALRIVEGSHRPATAEEVIAEKQRQSVEKERNDRTEAALNKRVQIAIRPPQD
jgi:hypothetical protein